MTLSQLPWETFYLKLSQSVSERSPCERLQVGCVLTRDNRVVSIGYNGSLSKHDHCDNQRTCLVQGQCIRTLHAEQNALIFANQPCKGCVAYVTHAPCVTCYKLFHQAGIIRIHWLTDYHKAFHTFDVLHPTFKWLTPTSVQLC